jgi:hypothetical protein
MYRIDQSPMIHELDLCAAVLGRMARDALASLELADRRGV